jgi:hypothetical protein
VKCDTSTGTPSCNGTKCSYVCNPGHGDCSANDAADTDGCETPLNTDTNCGACGNACSNKCTTHSNGEGQSFYDCTDKGTYTQAEATGACTAYGQATCTGVSSSCEGGSESAVCACSTSGFFSTGVCWGYAGSYQGLVFSVAVVGGVCSPCYPSSSFSSWN